MFHVVQYCPHDVQVKQAPIKLEPIIAQVEEPADSRIDHHKLHLPISWYQKVTQIVN